MRQGMRGYRARTAASAWAATAFQSARLFGSEAKVSGAPKCHAQPVRRGAGQFRFGAK